MAAADPFRVRTAGSRGPFAEVELSGELSDDKASIAAAVGLPVGSFALRKVFLETVPPTYGPFFSRYHAELAGSHEAFPVLGECARVRLFPL